jgi:hypothetical protein
MRQIEVENCAPVMAGDPRIAFDPGKRIDPIPYLLVCLSRLDPPIDGPQWYAVGRAIWGLTGGWPMGYILFDWWSSGHTSEQTRDAWDSFCGTPAGIEDRHVHAGLFDMLISVTDEVAAPLALHKMFVAGKLGPVEEPGDLWAVSA